MALRLSDQLCVAHRFMAGAGEQPAVLLDGFGAALRRRVQVRALRPPARHCLWATTAYGESRCCANQGDAAGEGLDAGAQWLRSAAISRTSTRRITFELSGRQRQDARARAVKMHRVPQAGPWWPAVGAPLERGVRHPCAAATRFVVPTLGRKLERTS